MPNEEGYYFGEPVVIVEDHGDGWVSARWQNSKVFRHWRDDIKPTPWGRPPKPEPGPADCPVITTHSAPPGYIWRAVVTGLLADGPPAVRPYATREEAEQAALAKYPLGTIRGREE